MKKNTWYQRHIHDAYVKKANKQAYRSRAVFKLEEIDKKYRLFKKGQCILDIGAAPGSWCQYIAQKIGSAGNSRSGFLCGIDILRVEKIAGLHFIQGDFTDSQIQQKSKDILLQQHNKKCFDIIVSDIAPDLTGITDVDQQAMKDILILVIEFAHRYLCKDGSLLFKAFHGNEFETIIHIMKTHFRFQKTIKPQASRSQSKEVYVLGQQHIKI